MSTSDMENPTHAIVRPTAEFPAEKLGKFDGAMFPLDNTPGTRLKGYLTLASIVLVIDEVGYRAHPTSKREDKDGVTCVVFHASPTPCVVKT